MESTRDNFHLRRRLSGTLAALAILFLILWAATYHYRLWIRFCNGFVFEISHGRTSIHIWDTSYYRIDYPPGITFGTNDEREWHWLPTFHFNTPSVNRGPGVRQWAVAIPLWMVSLASAGSSCVVRMIGRSAWHCANCGYDLRGLRDPRCPECGREVMTTAVK